MPTPGAVVAWACVSRYDLAMPRHEPVHRKRCKRYDTPWQAHYLTFSCFKRQAFLSRERTCRWLIECIEAAKHRHPFDVWAFVAMPEHVHLLILPRETSCISQILRAIKEPMAKRCVAWIKRNAPHFLLVMLDEQPNGKRFFRFWRRGGGYDRNLWTARDIHEKIRYIHDNPVRRGLVSVAEDWTWSSARAWASGIDGPLRINRDTVPMLLP